MNEAQGKIRPSQGGRNRAAVTAIIVAGVALLILVALALHRPAPDKTYSTLTSSDKIFTMRVPAKIYSTLTSSDKNFIARAPWGLRVVVGVLPGLRISKAWTAHMVPGQYTLILTPQVSWARGLENCGKLDRVRTRFYRSGPEGLVAVPQARATVQWSRQGPVTYYAVAATAPWDLALVSCGARRTRFQDLL